MGCINSKPDIVKAKKGKNASLKGKGRSNSNSSFESFEQKKIGRSNSLSSCSDNDELSDEEIEFIEKEQREQIWAQKALLRNRVRKEKMMDGGEGSAVNEEERDLLKQEEEMASLNNNAIKKQKQMRRRKLKRKAEKEQKWMVFSNLDCFDEADMTHLAVFLATIMKIVPTSEQNMLKNGNSKYRSSSSDNNDRNDLDNNYRGERMDTNGGKDFRYNYGAGNVIASYLTQKENIGETSPEKNVPQDVPQENFTSKSFAEKNVPLIDMKNVPDVVESLIGSPTNGENLLSECSSECSSESR